MQRKRLSIWTASVGIIAMVLAGCAADSSRSAAVLAAKVGKQGTVQFRRNLLGAASNSAISPTAGAVNNVEFSVSGTLSQVTDGWVILSAGQRDYCIPRENILLLDVSGK